MYSKADNAIISTNIMALSKTSLICTVYNEEKTIAGLIDSIANQSVLPNEVILVDGGSKDATLEIIKEKAKIYPKLKIKWYFKKGNRSTGRNEAIRKSTFEIILSTDAGCLLDKDWVKNIIAPFRNKNVDVVAGYYKGKANSIFQKCLIPYVLVMPDKVSKENFLPATRSMAFKKSVWDAIGGFNETLSHNEDYAFANKIKNRKFSIVFAKEAIVYWIPRNNLRSSFKMFSRFALGDIQANIFREKAIYIFLRYIFGAYLVLLSLVEKSIVLYGFIILLFLSYIAWSIYKNYKYVHSAKAFLYLPILQFTSDLAVLSGSLIGFIEKLSFKAFLSLINKNRMLFLILFSYILLTVILIQWGIPNNNHPFNYAMDEWHFSQAIRTFIKYGTGSLSGAASIPLYHIVSSILFIVPFYLLHIVNPLAIKGSLDNIQMQHVLFEVLRLHTLFYGILSIIVLYFLLKKFTGVISNIFISIFIFSPIWLLLTNYYKYDITLIFWIISTLYLILKFKKDQSINYFIFAGITSGLALATKFTALPLFIAYIISYYIFAQRKKYKYLVIGVVASLGIFICVGIPDLILGKGSYSQLLLSTLIESPKYSLTYNIGYPAWLFLVIKEFPSIFGIFLTGLYYLSGIFWVLFLVYKFLTHKLPEYKSELFLSISSLLFFLSLIFFGVDGGGNRALVIIPFMILLPAYLVKFLFEKSFLFRYKNILLIIFIIGVTLQLAQSLSWISVKLYIDPRKASSEWIVKNISKNSYIGIENIPIYQMLPDFIVKEFYSKQYNKNISTYYQYIVISPESTLIPKYVIVTNDFDNLNYISSSSKKDLVDKLMENNYKKIKVFQPNLTYYNLFADKIYFITANIVQMPVEISVYEKL